MDFVTPQTFPANKEYQDNYLIKAEKIPVAMVVASSGWVQNVNFTNQNNNNMSAESETNKMSAKGVLICRDNSHAFEDRTLVLDLPVKIGRSVARTRAASDNAIFDCKVLSRNHALLWYNAGKFYLQDTRSSNGTFVNNQRLSSTGLQSKATEVCSGDIVQFGVDVMESTRKVTHGCIIATLKLFLPDGKEAKASRTTYGSSAAGDVTLEDLYKLNQYVQEASRREQVLHSKLGYLQKLVENTRKAATQSWKALIDEDRLLTHVKTIESQLCAYSKNFTEEKIRTELIKLEEQKSQYQIAAKEALQKVHQEKLEVTQKLMALESRLNETEDECQSLHEISKHSQMELQELASKYTTAQKNLAQLEAKLAEKEQTSTEIVLSTAQEKQHLMEKVMRQSKIGHFLRQKLNENRSDSVKIHKEITSLRNYMQTLQDMNSKLSEDSKDGLNPIEAINTILDILNEMIADSENIDDLENLAVSEDNQNKLQEIDSTEKITNSSILYEKSEAEESTNENQNDADYILPPHSRRTLVNGKTNFDGNQVENEANCATCEDTSSIASDDTCSLIDEEFGEKSVTEIKPVEEKITRDVNTLEVRFATDLNGDQLEVHYDPEEENVVQGDDSSDSADSPNASISSTTAIDGKEEEKGDDLEEKENDLELDEQEGEHLEGDYVKTLKPLTKSESFSQCNHNRAHILQTFIATLESLKGDDDLEAQHLVNCELNELRDWLIREPNEQVIEKLKQLYYRVKNENSRLQEVNEELVILKEKFNVCNMEKSALTKQLNTFTTHCGDLLSASYSVPIQYFAPIAIAFGWMLLEKMF
ncbi:sarcolemmal membrane-associated protein [Diachasma alloeum]|uniref:sarcolemmal membrane-associated protein n=1 Tax=Diachasma alloeum TaxID=454923 RepID=UPI000738315F|nr:sarcolemmal membrane-associated protein [Diachasma alloeum]